MDAEKRFEQLVQSLSVSELIVAGQMFGKKCLKISGKAFLSLHGELLIFKLTGDAHRKALAFAGAALWDHSGKGRPMKEWVAIPAVSLSAAQVKTLAANAQDYVAAGT